MAKRNDSYATIEKLVQLYKKEEDELPGCIGASCIVAIEIVFAVFIALPNFWETLFIIMLLGSLLVSSIGMCFFKAIHRLKLFNRIILEASKTSQNMADFLEVNFPISQEIMDLIISIDRKEVLIRYHNFRGYRSYEFRNKKQLRKLFKVY